MAIIINLPVVDNIGTALKASMLYPVIKIRLVIRTAVPESMAAFSVACFRLAPSFNCFLYVNIK